MRSKIECDWCGKQFLRNRPHMHERNYCSRGCLGKANAERYRQESLRTCDYCGKVFEYRGNHKSRNKHFFCSAECGYAFKIKKLFVSCDWCGKQIYKKRSDVTRSEHNFCNYGCYIDFVNFHQAGAPNQQVSGETLYRRLAEMKIGRQLSEDEEVHHIDGSHQNNNLNNLQVLSASEHAKIHAAQKMRDELGRFTKKE
jgi:hypothetical protein